MTTPDFIKRLGELYARNLDIVRKKNADYAGTDDPFKNFRNAEAYGISAEKAIVVRMTDKMTRAANLLDKPPQVVDEQITDTLCDLANYAMILAVMIESKSHD